MKIIRGVYHPRGPQDVPLEVEDLLNPVSRCLADIDAERSGKTPWT